mmetsp:Transcript_13061/g.41744  ORF Transcript_13061/g.41744 Transcript_13061/m.41744 type:complete len:230 (-) Transcript_13061:500-1189(-)
MRCCTRINAPWARPRPAPRAHVSSRVHAVRSRWRSGSPFPRDPSPHPLASRVLKLRLSQALLPAAKGNWVPPAHAHRLARGGALGRGDHPLVHGLERLRRRGGATGGAVGDDLGRELARQHRPLHRAEELLACPVAREHKVGDGRRLARPVAVAAGRCGVHGARRADDGVLEQLGAALAANLAREEPAKLAQTRGDHLRVWGADPVPVRADLARRRRKDELEHRPVNDY